MATPSIALLSDTLARTGADIAAAAPRVAGAMLFLLFGWLLGLLLGRLCRRGMTMLVERLPVLSGARSSASRGLFAAPRITGRIVFWLVFLFFATAAVEALGLDEAGRALAGLAQYLPRVIAAGLVVLGGVLLGELARAYVDRFTRGMGGARPALGQAARLAIIALAATIALDQVGVHSDALVLSGIVVFGVTLGGLALAFGLGARSTTANILAAHYARKRYQPGDEIQIGDHRGRLREVTQTELVLDCADGEVAIPAQQCADLVVVRREPEA